MCSKHSPPCSDRGSLSGSSNASTTHRTEEELERLQRRLKALTQENQALVQNNLGTRKKVQLDMSVVADMRKKAKCTLFHEIEFLKSEEQFDDLSNSKTFGRRVLEQFHSDQDELRECWNACKTFAKTALNTRRADVQSTIQHQVMLMLKHSAIDSKDEVPLDLRKELGKNNETMVNKGDFILK